MALTDLERERIREEEWIRLQARENSRRTTQGASAHRPRAITFAAAFAGVLVLLFSLVRSV